MLRYKELPSVDRLNELLSYDGETGDLSWRVSRGGMTPGSRAGTLTPRGYVVVCIDGTLYYAHRVAWKMLHEADPDVIDHINGDRSDNRWCNLRSVDHQTNARKRLPNNADMASKHRGVTWCKARRKWEARVCGKRYGRYDCELEAASAAKRKRAELWGDEHGV